MRFKFNPLKPLGSMFTKKRRHRRRSKNVAPTTPPAPVEQKPVVQDDPYDYNQWKNKYEPDFRRQYIEPNSSVDDLANKYRQEARQDRAEGRQYADEFFEKYSNKGINPEQKTAMQEAANKDINRNVQMQNRQFLGQQGARGVRGGVNFAQQNELARNANDARLKATNDIRNLDEEMKLRNMAARFGIEQGFAGQGIYNRQSAEDLQNEYRRRLQEKLAVDRYSKMFQA